jgi:hypothetical protein
LNAKDIIDECNELGDFGSNFNDSWNSRRSNYENAIKVLHSTATPL